MKPNIKRILISLFSIGVVAIVAVAATGAFFNDTETSKDNVLAAGSIDLKVDNACYYNGQACINGFWGGDPNQPSPTPATNTCSCTWGPKDLVEGDLFFNLADIKPGDYEEDTISLSVKENDAWLCADVHLTSDDDVDCTDPEKVDDPSCNDPDLDNTDGDLADQVRFLWWADDGDNVLEEGERSLPSGPLGVLNVSQTAKVTLADSLINIWTGLPNSPIPQGGDTWYIGKAWCFGSIAAAQLPDDDTPGNNPAQDNNNNQVLGEPADGGYTCSGSGVNNAAQTDKLTVDISFRAEQARHNTGFLCNPPATPVPTAVPTAIPTPVP